MQSVGYAKPLPERCQKSRRTVVPPWIRCSSRVFGGTRFWNALTLSELELTEFRRRIHWTLPLYGLVVSDPVYR
ncbi:hypothetical protein EV192_108430 [Actinocrispum wychmicini]|uniref:Uncharacterized protein n=1 Tax=Actinocrispum wychmicini TaxID=1213861 RepID=A0A4R2JB54_9PSEU|nr:hypothetical protein [Actinocrispum wychmicini]TCO55142.1 hypothetical protein EV192_108430 [Actinocrispum wychmicini]